MIDDMKRDIQHTASESGLPASTYKVEDILLSQSVLFNYSP